MLNKSNPAAAAYLRMDIENLPDDKPEKKAQAYCVNLLVLSLLD